jgi:hypothetical protein
MAGLSFSQEKLFGYPLESGAVSFGKINAQNANAFFLLNNSSLLAGSITYETVTINFKGIKVADIPFQKPSLQEFGSQSFSFRGQTWTVIAVDYGGIYTVGSEQCYRTYTIQGVEFNNPEFAIS